VKEWVNFGPFGKRNINVGEQRERKAKKKVIFKYFFLISSE